MGAWLLAGVTAAFLVRPVSAQQGHTVSEVEPNATTQTATPATLHDTIVGDVHENGDVDFFSLDLSANAEIQLTRVSEQKMVMTLVSSDGVTVLGFGVGVARYRAGAAGKYYISVRAMSGCQSGQTCPYRIEIGEYNPPSGPGDPTTIFVTGDWNAKGIAAAADGAIYLTDGSSHSLARIDRNGNVTRIGTDVSQYAAPAVMNNGDILVSGLDTDERWAIKRVTPSGSVSNFFTSSGYGPNSEFKGGGITIGPDGDVWVSNSADGKTWRFSSSGTLKEKVALWAGYLAFSPAGVLHSTLHDGKLRRWVNGHSEVVFSGADADQMYGLAFDRDGYLYVVTGRRSGNHWFVEILLLDPTYHVVARPFASSNLDGTAVLGLAFARDASGAMTRRLLAVNGDGRIALGDPRRMAIVEVKTSAVRAVGWQIGAPSVGGDAPIEVTAEQVVQALLGGAALSSAEAQFVDRQGNNNGRLDVGDLRALLRANGQLGPIRRN